MNTLIIETDNEFIIKNIDHASVELPVRWRAARSAAAGREYLLPGQNREDRWF